MQTCKTDGSGYDACLCGANDTRTNGPGGAGAGTSTSTTATGAGGTGGGSPGCKPGDSLPCYSGPAGTQGIGACRPGAQICNADGTWGPCTGDVVPKMEDCATPADDACTGAIAPCGATTTWSRRFGDVTDGQEARTVTLDDAANVFVTSIFSGTADFGGGALASTGPSDLFVAKYTPGGAPVWSKHVAGAFGVSVLAIDGLGDLVLATGVSGLVDFGGGPLPGQDMIPELVLAKLDPQGGYLWAKRWASPGNYLGPNAVRVMPGGDLLLTVDYSGSLDLGCGAMSPPSSFAQGVAVAKLHADGTCVFSKSLGGSAYTQGVGFDAAGDVYVAGTFFGQADLGGGLVGTSGNDPSYIFLSKMSPDGVHLYSKTWLVGYPASCSVGGLAVDAAGNVVLTGVFGPGGGNPPPASVNFGGGALNGPDYLNTYLVRLDPGGTALWSKTFGPGQGLDVALDPNGQVVATGTGYNMLDFGAGPVPVSGVYVARFGADGAPLGARVLDGGTTAHVAVDGLGNVILSGGFTGSLDLAGNKLVSAGGSDGFVADIGP